MQKKKKIALLKVCYGLGYKWLVTAEVSFSP